MPCLIGKPSATCSTVKVHAAAGRVNDECVLTAEDSKDVIHARSHLGHSALGVATMVGIPHVADDNRGPIRGPFDHLARSARL